MRIIATPIKGKDLLPGDLYSSLGQDIWDDVPDGDLGAIVNIRTNTFCPQKLANEKIYKITIER
jgi:hypothetical protein